MKTKFSIYVHIPFCESKCIYCDFASFVCAKEIKEKYFKALKNEINDFSKEGVVSSIYFGGGTPSCVNAKKITDILKLIKKKFVISENCEITIECNPNSASFFKLSAYRRSGFNRVSFGVQSLKNEALKFLGRAHTASQAIRAVLNAQKAGFKNISVDFLIGLPNQKIEDLTDEALTMINLNVSHISAYMLQVEERTSLYKMVKLNQIKLPKEDDVIGLYNDFSKFLKKHKFEKYEISNFARNGFYSKHNINYWKMGEYAGFGLSAHSFLDGYRIFNSDNFADYFNGKNMEKEFIDNKKRIEEIIMLGLRCKFGFSLLEIRNLGFDISKTPSYKNFLNNKIIKEKRGRVYLNQKYICVSNSIICELLP